MNELDRYIVEITRELLDKEVEVEVVMGCVSVAVWAGLLVWMFSHVL